MSDAATCDHDYREFAVLTGYPVTACQKCGHSESEHVLDWTTKPPSCTCGRRRYVGGKRFTRNQHALHVAEMEDERRPCKGCNANICVAEGCYGDACLRPRGDA